MAEGAAGDAEAPFPSPLIQECPVSPSTSVQASIDYQKSITDGISSVATFVPKLLGFLVILAVGYIIAKVISKVVDKLLERAGFDRAVERGGVKKALEKSQFDASDIVA